ncbi:hypothetical protein ACFP1I_24455 [Dyadobacter subterraneus]|uniref:Uncharacterized protein n=1 Tax=Dyadobacter subterraneus TaxID=2773304 RepID=A0ABR9WM09_9BACT|nr:hypothetical protein [Dyadobacter subterraneus]MBE9466398.1 hypothetical protein [Dyadobacter subterraneus]
MSKISSDNPPVPSPEQIVAHGIQMVQGVAGNDTFFNEPNSVTTETLLQEIRNLQEVRHLDKEKDVALQIQIARLEGVIQDISERKKYAARIFQLVATFLFVVVFIVWLHGIGNFYLLNPFEGGFLKGPDHFEFSFHLSDTVIITLLTTTTANVVAFFILVTKYLFPNSSFAGNHQFPDSNSILEKQAPN